MCCTSRRRCPTRPGARNYVDNDRVGAALAGALAGSAGRVRLLLSLSAQVHRLLPRETVKLPPGPGGRAARVLDEVPDDAVLAGDPLPGREGLQTNNPGWPGFSSAGYVLGGGLNLACNFDVPVRSVTGPKRPSGFRSNRVLRGAPGTLMLLIRAPRPPFPTS